MGNVENCSCEKVAKVGAGVYVMPPNVSDLNPSTDCDWETDSDPKDLFYIGVTPNIPIDRVSVCTAPNGDVLDTRFYYFDENTGEYVQANSQQVGRNSPALMMQIIGEEKFEISAIAAGANVTKTAADLVADAIAAATNLRGTKSDGSAVARVALATDFIAKIDVDLKPVDGGAGAIGEAGGRSTTSEAVVIDNGTEQNLDPGASRTFGDLQQGNNGFYVMPDFAANGSIVVADGSLVEVTVVLASPVAAETTF